MVRVRFLHANPDPKAIMRSCPIFASSSSRSFNFWQLWVSLFWGLQLRFLLWQLLQINQFARKKNAINLLQSVLEYNQLFDWLVFEITCCPSSFVNIFFCLNTHIYVLENHGSFPAIRPTIKVVTSDFSMLLSDTCLLKWTVQYINLCHKRGRGVGMR